MRTLVFKGLLRPPMMLGVPTAFLILESVACSGFIIWNHFAGLLYLLPLHLGVWFFSLEDPYRIDIVIRSRVMILPLANKRFWGRQSYAP